jgi:hypothetical protein
LRRLRPIIGIMPSVSDVLAWVSFLARMPMNYAIPTMAVSAGVFLISLYSWYYDLGDPKVLDKFADIHKINPALGGPLIKAKNSETLYFAAYEHCIVIYLYSATIHYVIPRDPNRPVVISKIIDLARVSDPKYYDDKWLSEHFKAPPGKRPPIGGIAYEMERDPENWKWIGWREWQLRSSRGSVQYFQNGLIIGPMPYSTSLNDWRNIAIVYGTKEWHQLNTSERLPDAQVFP